MDPDRKKEPSEASKTGKSAVWIAVISALGVILAAMLPGIVGPPKGDDLSFTGIVKKKDGNSVSGAQVLVAVDQDTPQVQVCDSNGVFHVLIPEKTKALNLTVSASGYETKERDANPHRAGVEEIVLDAKVMNQPLPRQPLSSLSIKGVWRGTIDIPGQPLHFVLHVRQSGHAPGSAVADSPDQQQYGLIVDSISIGGNKVGFTMINLDVQFKGTLNQQNISGLFTQHGIDYPLTLTRD